MVTDYYKFTIGHFEEALLTTPPLPQHSGAIHYLQWPTQIYSFACSFDPSQGSMGGHAQ